MFWKKIRGGLVFGIACLTSPCCTPIIIPLTIALLAGTPAAVWLTANVGWVFGALTLISVVSFVIGFRWLWPRLTSEKISKPARPLQPATKP